MISEELQEQVRTIVQIEALIEKLSLDLEYLVKDVADKRTELSEVCSDLKRKQHRLKQAMKAEASCQSILNALNTPETH